MLSRLLVFDEITRELCNFQALSARHLVRFFLFSFQIDKKIILLYPTENNLIFLHPGDKIAHLAGRRNKSDKISVRKCLKDISDGTGDLSACAG